MQTSVAVLFQHAAWLLYSGRDDEYAQLCRTLYEHRTDDVGRGHLIARMCALVPTPCVSVNELIRRAQRAVYGEKYAHNLHALGLCQLRDGQYDAAIETFQHALLLDWNAHVVNWLGLALAYHHTGQSDEACRWLDQARTACDELAITEVDSLLHPHDRIAARLLLREAEVLIGGKAP